MYLDTAIQNHRLSSWVQPVERVHKKLISTKWLVTTVCAYEIQRLSASIEARYSDQAASGWKDYQNRGSECINGKRYGVELNSQKWTQKVVLTQLC
jgi:hypothetical protein